MVLRSGNDTTEGAWRSPSGKGRIDTRWPTAAATDV
jgi:hypothetical protein